MKLFQINTSTFTTSLALFILLAFSGCDPEKTIVTPEQKKVLASYEITVDNSTFAIDFNYSDGGIFESFVDADDPSYIAHITYQNNQITEVSSDEFREEYKYDANGNLIEILYYEDDNGDGDIGLYNKYLYSYNSNNQVEKEEEIYYYEKDIPDSWSYFTLYQYENSESKNPISSEYYNEVDGDGGTLYSEFTFTFDDKENPINKMGVNLFTNDFTTGFSPNNLIHAGVTGQNGTGSISADNTYDEDGDLLKSTYTIIWEGVSEYVYSVAFTYKEI